MPDSETLGYASTVIGGQRHDDDYQVVWRVMSIGRIMRTSGLSSVKRDGRGIVTSTAGRRSATTAGGRQPRRLQDKVQGRLGARIRAGLTD
ncbi:hypothetical protein [Bradyrhizobium sp. URHD0069]|uniref:hypothetical protein n=1 Tax=Bradyrhizobium sp. URHD0069 TaxID=1380355 RepID=UPI0004972929|nr:hypothetical protein [Bradyrhizobium sp. URHD0069]